MDTQQIAAEYIIKRGWKVVPIPKGKKAPTLDEWQNLKIEPDSIKEYFNPDDNIGVLLGDPASGLVDIDLDTRTACAVARYLLPDTGAKFGRKGKPDSHWLYKVPGIKTKKYQFSLNGDNPAMYVEIRSTGGQTVFPPSIHPSGESIFWSKDGEIAEISKEELTSAASRVAAASLIADHWPNEGSRQDAALALAGGLTRAGWEKQEILTFVEAVVSAAGDDEVESRLKAAEHTVEKAEKGEEVTGWPRLSEYIPQEVSKQVIKWLKIESRQEEPWDEPVPLYEHHLPVFPTEIYPPWIRNYVKDLAQTTQTPEDLAGMLVPAICATALSKKFVIEMRPGWKEPLNIYTMVVLPSGERKSPVFEDCIEPIQEYERTQIEFLRPEMEEMKTQKDILENRLKNEKSKASKGDTLEAKEAEQAAIKLSAECSEFDVPQLPRFIVDDISPERLASVLAEQRGKISVLSSEGGIFEIIAGRYNQSSGSGPNLDCLLKGYSGDSLRVDRQSDRREDYVDHPAITIGLTVQPDVLRGLLSKPGFRGRGLLARFLYSVPASMVGRRNTKPPARSVAIKENYNQSVKQLMKMPYGSEKEPFVIKLGKEAEKVSDEFAEWLEPQLAPGGDLELVKDWASKLHGTIGRIAGLLHVAENIDNTAPWEIPVSENVFRNAVSFGLYLIEHSKSAFAEMGADDSLDGARYVLNQIEKRAWQEFTKKNLFDVCRGKFKRVMEIEPVLNLLEDYGYIREVNIYSENRPGRKPSPLYKLNPLYAQYAQYAQYQSRNNSAYSAEYAEQEEEKNGRWEMEI